ncbi:MAG: BamA/TamA family outer membrane protein [Gemmatimonadota bacterium]
MAAILALASLGSVLSTGSALHAQDAGGAGPVSPDSADVIRAGLERPDRRHRTTLGDVVAVPFKLVGVPLSLAFDGLVGAADLALGGDAPSPLAGLYRSLLDACFRPSATTDLGPRSGLALVLAYEGLGPVRIESGASVRGSLRQVVQVGGVSERWAGGVAVSFQRSEEEHFWGRGLDTPVTAQSDFRRDRTAAEGEVSYRPSPWSTLALVAGIERTQVGRGGDEERPDLQDSFDTGSLFGAAGATRFVVTGLSSRVDRTRWEELQVRGFVASVEVERYTGIGGTAADFTLIEGAAGVFLPVSLRHALLLSGRTELRRGTGDGVPFTHLATLGGSRSLRAFEWGRFQDRDLLALAAEWRFEIWRDLRERGRLEGFTFWEAGGVARNLNALPGMRHSYGVGLLLAWNLEVMGRAWIAHGDEGTRISASLASALDHLGIIP